MLLAPAPAGGLTTSGKPTSAGEACARRSRTRPAGAGARHARGAQHRLHLGLVPEVAGRDRVHAGDAEVLAHLGEGHLQLLQDGQQPLHRAELPAEPLHGAGDLAGVERVVDPPVPGQAVPQPRRQAVGGLAGDQRQLRRRAAGRGLDEPRRRVEQIGRDKPGDDHAKNVPPWEPCSAATIPRHERRLRRAVLSRQPAAVRPRPGRGRRDGDRHRRIRPGRAGRAS